MTLGPQNADDSCLVNKTVPAGDTPVQPVQTKEKPNVIDEGGKESAPPPPSVRNSASGDDSGAEGGTRAEAEADAERGPDHEAYSEPRRYETGFNTGILTLALIH